MTEKHGCVHLSETAGERWTLEPAATACTCDLSLCSSKATEDNSSVNSDS